jgi:hypothetical protein
MSLPHEPSQYSPARMETLVHQGHSGTPELPQVHPDGQPWASAARAEAPKGIAGSATGAAVAMAAEKEKRTVNCIIVWRV